MIRKRKKERKRLVRILGFQQITMNSCVLWKTKEHIMKIKYAAIQIVNSLVYIVMKENQGLILIEKDCNR